MWASGDTALIHCQIHDNEALTGGGVYSDGRSLLLSDCQVYNNVANTGGGGGVAVTDGSLQVEGCTVHDNRADFDVGGGIAVRAGSLQVENSTISHNFAFLTGGGISLGDGVGQATVLSSGINGNWAAGMGGGIYVAGGTQFPTAVVIDSTVISANQSGSDGGGIAVEADRMADVSLSDVTVSYNTSGTKVPGGGGGVYLGSGTLWTDNVIVTGNTAQRGGVGGGLYLVTGTVWLDGPRVSSVFANAPDDVSTGN